jgi:fatty-acyl-CoA synthase
MAEVCLAITFTPHCTGVRIDSVDRTALAEAQRALPAADPQDARRSRRFVLCGKVLPGHQRQVRDEAGKALADREVGRIFVKGPSVMPGYFPRARGLAGAVGRGWLDTGDLGYAGGRDRRHRPRQGPDHRQRPQRLAAGYRMGHRPRRW